MLNEGKCLLNKQSIIQMRSNDNIVYIFYTNGLCVDYSPLPSVRRELDPCKYPCNFPFNTWKLFLLLLWVKQVQHLLFELLPVFDLVSTYILVVLVKYLKCLWQETSCGTKHSITTSSYVTSKFGLPSKVPISDHPWTCQQDPVTWMVTRGWTESINDMLVPCSHWHLSNTWIQAT